MPTLTMQDIADLARVRRPVVSVWRERYSASSSTPFPEPEREQPLLFEVTEIADWLAATGRGNNPEAALEAVLHSSAATELIDKSDHASALLLAQTLLGEPLGAISAADLHAALRAHSLNDLLGAAVLTDALQDAALRRAIDELIEAAFSGTRVLDRLVDGFTEADGAWASEALSGPATDLVAAIVSEQHLDRPRMIAPAGPGGLILAGALLPNLAEQQSATFAYTEDGLGDLEARVAWRRLAAHGHTVTPLGPRHRGAGDSAEILHLFQWQASDAPGEFTPAVERALIDLAAGDVLVVIGPAALMIDRQGRAHRTRLLTPSKEHTAPLRYAARLPKGLSRFGGRRRLALWVFATQQRELNWTVVGAHADTQLNAAACSAIAADVAAAVSGMADVRDHAFHSSVPLRTDRLLRQESISVPHAAATAPSLAAGGGERLARVWEFRSRLEDARPAADLLAGIDLIAGGRPARHAISIERGLGGFADDRPGVRIAPEHLVSPPETGSALVVGPDEVRGGALRGNRGIDRLTLEAVAPRARLTQPGDVVYVAAGGPAAFVDEVGGSVVLAPARVLRCLAGRHGRVLLPRVVAADIAAHTGTDRHTWALRTLPAGQQSQLASITQAAAVQRERLERELSLVAELEAELVSGFCDATLTTSEPPSPPTKDAL